ncbi:serine/threonine-protein kinase [Thermostaphylospora chromogena]|uniref:non-specific serine/threonine protein kinase n=1 Tax=Thermostaphylospora chromogena TaxID=35622 RepID=A0A1H1I3A8_9ACTN|nr:serine/threonine-protein kinase [Thermostaphylospora chromogena]SDR32184.1 Serine/threonine protein kinase [Thermostaphylospora chromogena]
MESPGAERMIARRYRLSRTLGQGGMGVVWEGYDTLLDRPVAVKEVIFPPEIAPAERQNLVIRTIREARAAARLNHSAIVSIYDVAEEDGRPWIVMELIRAMPLDEMVRTYGATPIRQVADIGCQMLSALRAAHAAGIVHRDVKPGNILVREDGTAVLTDFGLATVEGDASLTQVGTVAGSPAFMAPERVRGEKAGPASDLWALGATLYAAVMGRSPFERGDTMATMNAILEEEPDLSRMPRVLHPVLRGLMARDPEQRLTADQAEEMLAVLGTPPPRDPALRRLSRAVAQRMPGLSGRGRRALVVGGAVTTVAVLATVGWVTLGPRTPASLTADAASRATGRTATTAGTVTSEPRTPVPATPAATADARPTPTPTRTAAPRARGSALRAWNSPHGWSIRYPRGWKPSRRQSFTGWLRRDGGAHLGVAELSVADGDPMTLLRAARDDFVARRVRTIRMRTVPYPGGAAAEWEFVWVAGESGPRRWARPGQAYRELRRAVVVGDLAYVVEWTTLKREWQGQRRLLRTVLRGFTPK